MFLAELGAVDRAEVVALAHTESCQGSVGRAAGGVPREDLGFPTRRSQRDGRAASQVATALAVRSGTTSSNRPVATLRNAISSHRQDADIAHAAVLQARRLASDSTRIRRTDRTRGVACLSRSL